MPNITQFTGRARSYATDLLTETVRKEISVRNQPDALRQESRICRDGPVVVHADGLDCDRL